MTETGHDNLDGSEDRAGLERALARALNVQGVAAAGEPARFLSLVAQRRWARRARAAGIAVPVLALGMTLAVWFGTPVKHASSGSGVVAFAAVPMVGAYDGPPTPTMGSGLYASLSPRAAHGLASAVARELLRPD